MKKTAFVLTVSLLTGVLAAGASAQTRPSSDPARPAAKDNAQRQAWAPESGHVETSKLIGTKVKTADGKDVAEIDQLVINQSEGKITHVVLGKGGVLGIGEQKIVLKWSDVKLQQDPDRRGRWVAMVDQAKLDTAPRYEARRDDGTPAASPSSTTPKSDKK